MPSEHTFFTVMQSPCRSEPQAGPIHPSLAVKNETSSNFSTFKRFSVWFPRLLSLLTLNMTDYIQNLMFQRSNFLEDSWQSFSMFSRKGSIFIYCTLRETQHLKANSLKELFCPKALTKNCFCSAYILPYKREGGGKNDLKIWADVSGGFLFCSQEEVTHAALPDGLPATSPRRKNPLFSLICFHCWKATAVSLPEHLCARLPRNAPSDLCPSARSMQDSPSRAPGSSKQHSHPPPLPQNIAGDQKCVMKRAGSSRFILKG